LNIPPVTFIFSYTRHFLINTWFSKLIRPITTSLCVPYIATWKHFTSSLWVNVTNFIFRLLHIYNLLTLSILTPFHLPCTPFANYAHLSIDCENTSVDYTNFFVDCAHNFKNCVNTPNDWVNIAVDLACTPYIPSLDHCIPNMALLQLLFICRSKIKTMFIAGFMICYLSSSFFICGFCISHPSLSSFVSKFAS
jgi:hypothetical protein